jgi:hypothetical protein
VAGVVPTSGDVWRSRHCLITIFFEAAVYSEAVIEAVTDSGSYFKAVRF